MALVLIPPGEFMMGASDKDRALFLDAAKASDVPEAKAAEVLADSEQPQHRVRIARPFYLAKCELTRGQWLSVMNDDPSPAEHRESADHPMRNMSWDASHGFFKALNAASTEEHFTYTLPTEAQWEYACRAGTTTMWHFGDDASAIEKYGWFKGSADGQLQPVGQLLPNPFGLYDMYGNLWEWCADKYSPDYYRVSPANDPPGPAESSGPLWNPPGWEAANWVVTRGGAYGSIAAWCRSGIRNGSLRHKTSHAIRVAIQIDPARLDRSAVVERP